MLTILFEPSNGQSFSYPILRTSGLNIEAFVPKDWVILDSANGDLNKDGLKDAAVIIQHKDSITIINSDKDTVLTQPRILMILFRSPNKNIFKLNEQSNSFILYHDNSAMDDPYQGIAIEKGVLKIDFHLFYNMGSWYSTSSTYKFRYDGKNFLLIGANLSTIHRATLEFEDYSYNFLTKKRIYIKGNDEKGAKKGSVKNFLLPFLKTLKTFNRPYSWEIETDINL